MTRPTVWIGGPIFDGVRLRDGCALVAVAGIVRAIVPERDRPGDAEVRDLGGAVLCPGFVDLQVNGGGGVMLGDDPTAAGLSRIAAAHRGTGTTAILPTLITDTPDVTRAAIAAVRACRDPAIAGLHLEGPHIAASRKGAHDPSLIRPMAPADLELLTEAARTLPALLVTLAPEAVRPDQVRALASAGAVVSIGHSDAGAAEIRALVDAGARSVTHLFNAMSQMGPREPGLAGAALSDGRLSAGLIADGIHVHPDMIGLAMRAKRGDGAIYLVSDAMAVAGTAQGGFKLGGRPIVRAGGALRLRDGTLAGADLSLADAVRYLVREIGVPPGRALAMATSIPAAVAGLRPHAGHLRPGGSADVAILDL